MAKYSPRLPYLKHGKTPAKPIITCTVKHNSLEDRDEKYGVMNRYFAKSDRTPIPGRRASNRKGTALSSGSPRAGNNKFRLHGRAETAAALDLRGGATELTQVWRG